MDEDVLAQFVAITSAAPERATQYLRLTENNLEQAIQLYFESDGVDMGASLPSQQPLSNTAAGSSSANAINVDDEDGGFDPEAQARRDEEMARRMQQEMYGGQGGPGDDEDAIRAPDARRMDTLVGGPDDWQDDESAMNAAVFDQLNRRQRRAMGQRGRPGIFNQHAPQRSIWNEENGEESSSSQDLSRATGGASDASSKSNMLARMFQPPFDLITPLRSIDGMRSEGKEEEKWIMVNVQDPNIFDCQVLNRDLWKHEEIRNTIKSNFIFKQYNKGDLEAQEYFRLYFPLYEADNEYPHISILDPRTGEQVKTWSGPPAPKAGEFLMQLHEFLDRYSLDEFSRNPVAKRKPEQKKQMNIDKMTEEEMLQMAMQESMGGAAHDGAAANDPDDLTRSVELGKGKDKAQATSEQEQEEATNTEASVFASISSSNPHIEPEAGDKSATRIQFRHSSGRVVRRFNVADPVRRIFEWLKASPIEGKEGIAFELRYMGKDLIEHLDETIEEAGLKNGSVNVEFES